MTSGRTFYSTLQRDWMRTQPAFLVAFINTGKISIAKAPPILAVTSCGQLNIANIAAAFCSGSPKSGKAIYPTKKYSAPNLHTLAVTNAAM